MRAYQPIEDYGVVGNMHTVALVGRNGSIDWMCFPHFDSPSVFAAILDHAKGGRFGICPSAEAINKKQFYWPDTNVLVTRFFLQDAVGEIVDFMPIGRAREGHGYHHLVRRVTAVRGSVGFRMECLPAFGYARDGHRTEIEGWGARFCSPALSLWLEASVPLSPLDGGAGAEFGLDEGQSVSFVLHEGGPSGSPERPTSQEEASDLLRATVDYWHGWLSHSTYRGRWREMVNRSALVLKLLTYEPTGAIVAAPTCSLPEDIGGVRNWDYRYTWIRDAAFTLYALMRIGFTDEATRFMHWLEARCCDLEPDAALRTVYSIDGRGDLTEETLGHLDGYMGSRPVRIGNAAYRQFQLDIYGELMDSVYLYNKHSSPISYELWTQLRRLVNWVCDNWHREDEGIWEVRGGRRHFVYSKLMCWVAVDRGLRLAEKRSFPADRARWLRCRDEIYEEIMQKGWNPDRGAFVQHYGSHNLDAANLIMPLVFFLSPTDPRMLRTLDAILKPPAGGGLVSNSLVHRYNVESAADGLEGEEGTFNMCSFWLVEALTRAGRIDRPRLAEARYVFEQMLGYANHLGLYAEETGPSGEALGNFPQAFTHLSLISAAFNLDRALGESD